ncbi:MAG: DUF4157 domain-containing protein [Nodularia sp. CChRGM 3473]
MYSRQHKTAKSSANKSDTPVSNQFAPRRFVIQPQAAQTPQHPDLQAQSADSLLNLPIFSNSPPTSPPPIQMKLTIGQPGDKYEQEADRVAADVVQRINAPESERVQRQEIPEDEELQMKPMVQRLPAEGGMAATPELEASIQQAQSSGQPLAESIRQPMEQAFGADFSGVKVHTDSQSDQLNQSIQAKAFTTGQDIFFRQEAYNPGSRAGQELIAHELTHVVQQSSGKVQRAQQVAVVQRLNDEDIDTKPKKKEKERLQKLYNQRLGFSGDLYEYAEEEFSFYFEKTNDLSHLEDLINAAIKKAEAKKTTAEEKSTEAVATEPKAVTISTPVSTTVTKSAKKKKTKKNKPQQDFSAQFFSNTSATKQETVYVQKPATNTLIQGWITSKPSSATITLGEIFVSEDTVYIYATVSTPDTTVKEYPQVNTYNIETHYHPVPTSNNFLHVKRSAGSDAGNVVQPTSWLIPGGKATLRQAVMAWNNQNPNKLSPHNW